MQNKIVKAISIEGTEKLATAEGEFHIVQWKDVLRALQDSRAAIYGVCEYCAGFTIHTFTSRHP